MKQIFTLLFFAAAFSLGAQAVFVKQNATGANNGTTWADAFTSLDQALLAPTSGGKAIWVAAGTYKPSTPAPNNSFLLSSGTNLYGGFAGTETALNQRNIAANPTILSGDIMGNDVAGDFTTNRTDNAQHVLVVYVETGNTGSIIDGFTVQNGHTLVGTPNTDLTRRGGGILLNAKAEVRNCTFVNNFGESGAGIAALDALSNNSSMINCTFESNSCTEDAILFLRNTPTALIKKCSFINNKTRRGAFYPANSVNVQIDSCLFDGNTSLTTNATKFYGGAMFTWQANFTLTNSIFRNNKADNAAAMYCDGREFDSEFTISNCTFENNETVDYGGTSIFNSQTKFTLNDCVFKGNKAPSSGAALYNSANTSFTVNNCTFESNTAAFAGAIANYGLNCIGTYNGCTFKSNKAVSGGGALSNGFKADVTYKDCTFLSNSANYGGAIFTQNDTTGITLDGCWFQDNEAAGTSGTAGAVYINNNIYASIKGTTFFQNRAIFGGALSANGNKPLTIDKSTFVENVASTQGAAINFNHVDVTIVNSLFAKNINTGVGAGGAISNNAASSETSIVRAVNTTFTDNVAVIGAGVAQWESTTAPEGIAQFSALNCLFQNPDGDNYAIEEGTPDVTSLGGNQSSDITLESYLNGSKDLHSTFNNFQDANANNYAHTIDSPASDGGVSPGAPGDDFTGVPRWGIPDVGYREVKVSGTTSPSYKMLPMHCAPNPANDFTILSFSYEGNGQVQVAVWNQLGQQISQYQAEKTANDFSFELNTSQFAAGSYKVQVRMGKTIHESTFVKN